MNSKPLICWQNLLNADPGPQVTHSADESGYPFVNISDWRDYTFWKSSETGDLYVKLDAGNLPGQKVTVDCMAIAGHNLASAGVTGLSLSWSDDDIIYTDCFDPVTPDDDGVIFRHFDSSTHRFFMLVIPAGYSEQPAIGIFFTGEALIFPSFPDPGFDPDGMVADTAAEYSSTGRLLGVAARSLRRQIKAGFRRLPESFIKDNWVGFWESHSTKPFFFAWDPSGRPEEVYLVRFSETRLEAPYEKAFRSLYLSMTGAASA